MNELARAKVNLFLHVTGRRADGFHLLESLVVFPGFGDVITVENAATSAFTLSGSFAHGLSADTDNLVLKAERAFVPDGPPLAINLQKELPVASGIGGGSADAGAVLRLLARREGRTPDAQLLNELGADVPMCFAQKPSFVGGVGEKLTAVNKMPSFAMLLVNPGIGLSTPEVFAGCDAKMSPELLALPEGFDSFPELLEFLNSCKNDLEAPACHLAPQIGDVLAAIANTDGCARAAMSGSGATCFGLFAERSQAEIAREKIAHAHPNWWVKAAPVSAYPSSDKA